ncbi:MAG: DUF3524 domain-containing protein [Spirochaetes bacterium]|nr:DUF3524 domain-containing protein [Spirochaetota bacterium]
MKKILIVEPFYTGSHAQWIEGLRLNLRNFETEVLSLEGRSWKWRMHGGAVTLADMFNRLDSAFDLVIASDMLDLPLFRSLVRTPTDTKYVIYFHENQLTYPWSPDDPDTGLQRDEHYAFINYASALTADFCFFNSDYHRESFFRCLRGFLKKFPDHNNLNTVDDIEMRSDTLHLSLDLKKFKTVRKPDGNFSGVLNILWNHRWEYDKNPEMFHRLLLEIEKRNIDFRLILLGEKFLKTPEVLKAIYSRFPEKIIFDGYAETFEEYASYLKTAHVLPVVNNQDFFGISVMEAVCCGVIPLLPDRLAYPELYDISANGKFFYSSFEELISLITDISLNFKNYDTSPLIDRAESFDWCRMSSVYEKKFNEVMARKTFREK